MNRHIASIHRLISLSVCLPTSHSAKFFIPTPNSHAKRRWYGPSSRGKCSFQICLAAWILLCFSDADHVTKLCVVAQVRIKERPSSPWTSFSHPYMFTAVSTTICIFLKLLFECHSSLSLKLKATCKVTALNCDDKIVKINDFSLHSLYTKTKAHIHKYVYTSEHNAQK